MTYFPKIGNFHVFELYKICYCMLFEDKLTCDICSDKYLITNITKVVFVVIFVIILFYNI